jgi:hypothetical protein
MGDDDRAVRALIANSYIGDVGELGQDDLEEIVNIVLTAYRAGQAATPDGPRGWALPAEPGPEVTAVRDRLGRIWSRVRGLPLWGSPETGSVLPFVDLLDHYGPLTDVTPATDGQDGRDG